MNVRTAASHPATGAAPNTPMPTADPARPVTARSLGRRAVVLGGSLAGLLTARVLADRFDQVVIIDRDDLQGHPGGPRRGVPQGRHSHGLLVGGSMAMERLLPGLSDDLVAAGAVRTDTIERIRWWLGGTEQARFDSGLSGLLASRPLIEDEVRRRILSLPNVELIDRHDVAGLVVSPDRSRILGAQIVPRATGADDGPESDVAPSHRLIEDGAVPADLVVDATGRGSPAAGWLAELGYPPVEESVVLAGMMYVTRRFRQQAGVLDELDGDVIGSDPKGSRSGVALRLEDGTWIVTLAGGFGERPPTELAEFLVYARTLPTSGLAQIIEGCRPVGNPRTAHCPTSRWRHWETASGQPEGFLVIGDAMCSFNPVYGQGMSSAALQAEALRGVLNGVPDSVLENGLDGLPARAAKAFATVIDTPWTLATGADRRHVSQPAKGLPERLLDRYLDRLLTVAPHDPVVTLAFFRVLNLLATPPSLVSPRIALRVLRPGRRRRHRPRRSEVPQKKVAGMSR